jgi:hypothetical protein
MRFVKFTLIGLIGITLAFFSLGFFHPSFQYENQVEVQASVEDSYRIFTNESLAHEWLYGYKGQEILKGKPLIPGSRFLMKFDESGRSYEFIEELVAVKENEKFIFDMETDFFNGKVEVYFEGDISTTTIKAFTTVEAHNLFYKSMFYILKNGMSERAQAQYEDLKDLIEKKSLTDH